MFLDWNDQQKIDFAKRALKLVGTSEEVANRAAYEALADYYDNHASELKRSAQFAARNAYAKESQQAAESTIKASNIRKYVNSEFGNVKMLKPGLVLNIYQQDWMPGFAAFLDDGAIQSNAPAHLALNIGSTLLAVESVDLSAEDVPYMLAETLMHEIIHALESWASVEFSEERVEQLLTQYREKYKEPE
ncbi:MAG: hypothetical protein AB2604_10625 [Candidatus Thiodiazotropha taylori]